MKDHLIKKILIVEDVPALLEVLCDKFKREGFLVKGATDGRWGLELTIKYHPDILLVDLLMPIMDGVEMITELSKNETTHMVPVVILTNLSEREHREALAGLPNIIKYLWKNELSLDEIVSEVKNILGDLKI
jgi:DNA-binding response OmpR family regulator